MTHAYPDTRLLIANEWVPSQTGATLPVINPATGEAIGRVAHAAPADLDRALAAAERGFATWRRLSAHERSALMRQAATLLRADSERIAHWLTLEQGKPLREARAEVASAAGIIEWFADEGLRLYGRIVPARSERMQQWVTKEPVGPVAAFTPWNFPINQIVRKLSAALASGCSFLVKAAEDTPASAAALIDAFVRAGVPEGVVGLVFGDPQAISAYLIAHPTIRKVSFTGSTAVGKQLAALAGSHMKRVTMELGGHAPVIVAEDADVATAATVLAAAKFRNAGQVCISPTRFLVHRRIKRDFLEALIAQTETLRLGAGLDETTTLGPLAHARRVHAMEQLVTDAVDKGALLLTGGQRPDGPGFFYAPTLVDEVPLDAALFNQEPFGPVAGIRGFDTLDEAIAEANRLPYGLAAYAFTQSFTTLHRLSRDVQAGMLWINQGATPSAELPFGGIRDSGYGSEGGPEALEAYLSTKAVAVTAL
ncbi:NAD-dependent succinate-semialdehyde dehydrogenase [Hydrogenophaga electricum]|uniref:NAD-dependent succinate-semialdehyde dehydrogenase n=1 Tax=Hydrogenophaga electricum TaxID=1230953 RepID=A0ABQ6C2T3_9BURK|nr:NAD-dependent succinate-semialdehyde dehydrogenase [Hydrogenophaga electricum]GLS14175.1 NAD-dependent succinate-semialdehyde dehydrogenase [Hydrogenophaga electricum]